MSKSSIPTALELFQQFQPRFREVEWNPLGFHKHQSANAYHFLPKREGEYQYRRECQFNLKESGLSFSFTYDPTEASDPRDQLQLAAWQAILSGPFANRKFYVDPDTAVVESLLRPCVTRPYRDLKIPIRFTHDEGPEIAGLWLSQDMEANCWHFFVPADSREGMAIANALVLERAQAAEESRRSTQPVDIEKLRYELDVSLAAVPAP